MDDLALLTLRREMNDDCKAAIEAVGTAAIVFADQGLGRLAGCGHYIARFFNIVEQMALRVAKAFENNIDDDKGWHSELIRRMTLDFPEIRPALFPREVAGLLQNVRGFRHIFTRAYDLDFDPRQLELQLEYAQNVAMELHPIVKQFIAGVAAMHAIPLPPD